MTMTNMKLNCVSCDQCEYKGLLCLAATWRTILLTHIKSKHEGVNYPCDQCDFKETCRAALLRHTNSKHKGIIYPCDQCDFIATWRTILLTHIKSKYEGVISL